MRERAPVWGARAFFVTLLGVPVILLLRQIAVIPVDTHLWPFGRVTGFYPFLAIAVGWVLLIIVALLAFAACFFGAAWLLSRMVLELIYDVHFLWLVAWRKKHKRWKDRHVHEDSSSVTGYSCHGRYAQSPTYVYPEKPGPLVRGRIGSR
jgi:hypothetical protein